MVTNKKWTALELAEHVLKDTQRPLSAWEIWEIAKSKGWHENTNLNGETPAATISARVYSDMRYDSGKTIFALTEERPKRFYLQGWSGVKEQSNTSITQHEETSYKERDLHPFLAYYASQYLQAYVKTINHTKSKKGEFAEWLHPDMIGCYFPFDDRPTWKHQVVEFCDAIGKLPVKLYSFELKKILNFTNLREAFFQTISNSSWAHEGYLVACEVAEEEEFKSELQRLSSSFGIGVIKIDIRDPDNTRVLYPAKNKELDWDAINKLSMNKDFAELLERIQKDIKTKEVRKELYDKILTPDELLTTISTR